MQKDYTENGAVNHPSVPQILPTSPPPSFLEDAVPHYDYAPQLDQSTIPPAPAGQSLAVSPPTAQTALSSQDEIESLIRKSETFGLQYTNLRNACIGFLRRHQKFAPLREEVLLQRFALNHVLEDQKNQRRFVDGSQRAFLGEAQALITSLSDEYSPEKLATLQTMHDQVVQDHDRQIEYSQKTQLLANNVSDQEFKLQSLEHKIAQLLIRMSTILNEMALPDNATYEPSSSPSEASREDFPPLIQHYFDKAGDVLIERDKAFNLELDHRAARADRALRIEQGRPPSMNEDDFEANFKRELDEADQNLNDAVRKSELARAVCIGEGLDPEYYRKQATDPPKEDSLVAHSEGADVPHSPASHAAEEMHNVQIPSRQPIYETIDGFQDSTSVYPSWPKTRIDEPSPDERVRSWIETVGIFEEPAVIRSRAVSETGRSRTGFRVREYSAFNLEMYINDNREQHQRTALGSLTGPSMETADSRAHPPFRKRSTSNPELQFFIAPLQQNFRQATIDSLKASDIRVPS